MALTAGKAAKLNHISRTALLYYDEIGLVSPSQRSEAGYRLYSQADMQKLQTVLDYRAAGIALEDISGLLSGGGDTLEAVLLKRLNELNAEIIELKKRQSAVIGILQGISQDAGGDSRQSWHNALEQAGIVGDRKAQLHADFEEHSPQMHERFLQALGFQESEIRMIREYYAQSNEASK